MKSFIITPKNPHNTPARTFALKTEEKHHGIYRCCSWDPTFPGGIAVSDNCDTNTNTGLEGSTFFTGARKFTMREIEVFEITDPTILRNKSCSPIFGFFSLQVSEERA
jgi:hypothetical protein